MSSDSSIHTIASVVIPVPDQDRAIEFYRDVVGFEVRADVSPAPDFRWIEMAPPGAATLIGLAVPRGGMWGEVGGDTNISLAAHDVAAEHARFRGFDVDVDDHLTELPGGVPPMFRFRDPFGNVLQVIQPS